MAKAEKVTKTTKKTAAVAKQPTAAKESTTVTAPGQKKTSNKLSKQIRPGVMVTVRSGRDKNKQGEVESFSRKLGLVYVKGISLQIDYKKDVTTGKKEKILKARGIPLSKLALVK